MSFKSTKIIELGSCAFRQPNATSHCKFLHGYRLTAKFWFEAKELDSNNWVVDFGGLKNLKNILQTQFDHTTCIAESDPELKRFVALDKVGVCDLRVMEDGVGIEKFAEWCYNEANTYIAALTDTRCKCTKVEVFEHENNSAIYEVSKNSGVDYMNERCDAIEEAFNSTEEIAEEIATAVDNKQQADNITRPPFTKKAAPLRSRKSSSWADDRGTFGI